jgi:CRP-like cAMP-binding protein
MDHAIGTFSMCRISRIGADVVRDLHQRPAVAQALQTAARVDEATMRAWLVNLGRRSAVERLAHLFCELFVRLRAVGLAEGNSFVLPVMQHDLADTTGMTTVHINRTLGALKKAGLIVRKSKHLTILDLPRLMAFAEFEPHYLQLKQQTPEQGHTLLDGAISRSVAEVLVTA